MASTGVLIVHGFTGSRATVAPLVPVAESLGFEWSLPQLRGHWTKAEDLRGVTYQDLLADALAAFDGLRATHEKVAIVGLSVGGLLALDIASRRGSEVAALAVLAPAISYVNSLTRLSGLIARFVDTFSGDPTSGFSDPSYAANIENYASFPTATFLTIYRAARPIARRLGDISVPTLVIAARHDRIVQPAASQLVYNRLGSRQKELIWFERSGHELLLDCESATVCARIRDFLDQKIVRARS